MESMYGDPHAAHRSALAAAGSHSHHSVSVSPASAAAAAAAAHLNSHGAAAAAAAAAAMHHSAAAAAAAAAQHSQSPYHSLGNHVSAQQVGANHMAAAAAAAAASSSVPDVHKRDKDAIYGYVTIWSLSSVLSFSFKKEGKKKRRKKNKVQYCTVHRTVPYRTVLSVACRTNPLFSRYCGQWASSYSRYTQHSDVVRDLY